MKTRYFSAGQPVYNAFEFTADEIQSTTAKTIPGTSWTITGKVASNMMGYNVMFVATGSANIASVYGIR